MLDFRKLFGVFFITLQMLIPNDHLTAQANQITINNLKHPISRLTIAGLPAGGGYHEVDECGVCLPFGSKKQVINGAQATYASQVDETYYAFQVGETYQLDVSFGRLTRSNVVFWHVKNTNTNTPTAVPLATNPNAPRGTLSFHFPYEKATDGDVLVFSVFEEDVVQEHGDAREFLVYIPIQKEYRISLDMDSDGELFIENLGNLSLYGLPKWCDAPIASITTKSNAMSDQERQKLVQLVANQTQPTNYIDAETTESGYIFELFLTPSEMGFIDHRKLYFRHFQQQEDGEFIEASSDQVHLASHQFGQLDEDIFLHAEFPFHPKAASTGDVLEIQLVINQDSYYLYLPVRIAGKATPPAQVPVLGSTVSPKIPYMVLHDPPGDASFSSFESGKSFCRSTSLTLGNGTDFSANAAVKLGIAGSAGFIVTTDFEFSTTLSTGLTLSTTQTSENTYETCLASNGIFRNVKLGKRRRWLSGWR